MYRFDKDRICENAKAICQIMFASGFKPVTKPIYFHYDDFKDDSKTITTCEVQFLNGNDKNSVMYGINIFATSTTSIRLLCKDVILKAINHEKEVKELTGENNEYAKALSDMHEFLNENIDVVDANNFTAFTRYSLENIAKQYKGAKHELQSNLVEGIKALEEVTKDKANLVKDIIENKSNKNNDAYEKYFFEHNYATIDGIELIKELKEDKTLKGYNPNMNVDELENQSTLKDTLKQKTK